MSRAFVFPGQGAQAIGMGRDLADAYPAARAVFDEPSVLLLDEPTGALDAKATALAEGLIKHHLKAGHAVILVSHDPKQVKRLADRKLTLSDGRARMGRV